MATDALLLKNGLNYMIEHQCLIERNAVWLQLLIDRLEQEIIAVGQRSAVMSGTN